MELLPLSAGRPSAVSTRRRTVTRTGFKLAVGIALVGAAMASRAGIVNGSFETGTLSGWTPNGVTAVIGTGGGGPTNGAYQAYLDTSPSDSSLPPQTSTLSQTFTGGGVVSFSWNFLTNEDLGGSYVDSAYVVVDGTTYNLADTYSSFVPSKLGGYADMTGYQDLQINLSGLGTHTITFAVADGTDGGVDSALLVDNVTVSIAAVPEPAVTSLFALGLGVIGLRRWRKARD